MKKTNKYQVNKGMLGGTWFDYTDTVSLKLRPFSIFNMNRLPSESIEPIQGMKSTFELFDYCVVEWKGIYVDEDTELECTSENKKLVFEFDQEMITFVLEKTSGLREGIVTGKELKNLKTSQTGTQTVKE